MRRTVSFISDLYFGMGKGRENYFVVEGTANTDKGLFLECSIHIDNKNTYRMYHVRNIRNFQGRVARLVRALELKKWITTEHAEQINTTVIQMLAAFDIAGF